MSVALAHDWLTGMRGGEKCLELLGTGFARADLYCLLHKKGSVSTVIENRRIHTSVLQHIPNMAALYRYFLPVFPWAIRTLGKPDADLLISTSHCAAKALPVNDRTRHLCYCFTPMRYAWTFHDEYFGASPLKRAALAPLLGGLRRWDRTTAQRVDHFVAISHHVRKRIEKFYGREADVVYPPADTAYFTPDTSVVREDMDLIVSALVPYKKIDVAVQAYNANGRALVVVGTGTEFNRLRAMAGPNIRFTGWQPDDVIRDYYRRCRFLVFPGEEDYGIVPVEAMACGMPVLAYRRGGVTETVIDGVTGRFFDTQSAPDLNRCIASALEQSWAPEQIRAQAERLGGQAFIDGMARSIETCLLR